MVDEANEQFKTFSKFLEIRRSAVRPGPASIRGDSPRYYMESIPNEQLVPKSRLLQLRIRSGFHWDRSRLLQRTPRSDCFRDIRALECCPKMKFCGSICQQIAEYCYHKAICGNDLRKSRNALRRAGAEKTRYPSSNPSPDGEIGSSTHILPERRTTSYIPIKSQSIHALV
jgi:hypothetical protein